MDVLVTSCGFTFPTYGSKGAAGFDLRALDSGRVPPGGTAKVNLGIATAIPKGYCALVIPRSGLGSKGIILQNSVGLIDEDYRGDWVAVLRNESCEEFVFNSGDRLCQGVFVQYARADFVEVDELPPTERGAGGFGSTGI